MTFSLVNTGKHLLFNLSNAQLESADKEKPFSSLYKDIYFSTDDALGESEYVFLEKNNLNERWKGEAITQFTIAECGFGTGLNFLNTCKLWCNTAPENARLHYISCEKHPLLKEDLQQIYSHWPELLNYSEMLLKQYTDHTAGIHRLHLEFDKRPITLDLYYGDALESFKSVYQPHGFRVDAWFLDGFSPALNPDMWSADLFTLIAKLSKTNTTLSTYSVAGHIRRNLKAVGFTVSKEPGFGRKRHMLCASFHEPATGLESKADVQFPAWFIQGKQISPEDKIVTVIGAGLAGCSTAYALACKGWLVNLIEREDQIASKASGNPQGIVHLKVSSDNTASSCFELMAYLYAIRQYQLFEKKYGLDWKKTGLVQLAHNDKELDKQSKIIHRNIYSGKVLSFLTAEEASQYANMPLSISGLVLPSTGSVNPRQLCKIYSQHPNITTYLESDAIELKKLNRQWQVITNNIKQENALKLNSHAVVIANSIDAQHLSPSSHYPLVPNKGQVNFYKSSVLSQQLQTILCTNTYIIPAINNVHSVGGSFTPNSLNKDLDDEKSLEALAHLRQIMPTVADSFNEQKLGDARASTRCSTPDYLPIVGPVEDMQASLDVFKELSLNARKEINKETIYEEGLFVNLAHGSHGLSYTPLVAEYLASLIANEALPCSNEVLNCLHPIRFLIRNLKKQKRPLVKI